MISMRLRLLYRRLLPRDNQDGTTYSLIRFCSRTRRRLPHLNTPEGVPAWPSATGIPKTSAVAIALRQLFNRR